MARNVFRRDRGGPVSVPRDAIAHHGWVYKQSKHLEVWRHRWIVLLKNGTMFTFENEAAGLDEDAQWPVTLGVPTERFVVRALAASKPLRRERWDPESEEDMLRLYIDYPSTRNRLRRRLPGRGNTELPSTRRRFIYLDAEMVPKLRWKAALREVLKKLPHLSAEDVSENNLEAVVAEGAEAPGTTTRSSGKVVARPGRHHGHFGYREKSGYASDTGMGAAGNSYDDDGDDLKGWASDSYQRR